MKDCALAESVVHRRDSRTRRAEAVEIDCPQTQTVGVAQLPKMGRGHFQPEW